MGKHATKRANFEVPSCARRGGYPEVEVEVEEEEEGNVSFVGLPRSTVRRAKRPRALLCCCCFII